MRLFLGLLSLDSWHSIPHSPPLVDRCGGVTELKIPGAPMDRWSVATITQSDGSRRLVLVTPEGNAFWFAAPRPLLCGGGDDQKHLLGAAKRNVELRWSRQRAPDSLTRRDIAKRLAKMETLSKKKTREKAAVV